MLNYEQTIFCKNCSKAWDLYKRKEFSRDTDSINCTCGQEIFSWSGGVVYLAKPSEKKAGH